MRIQIIGASFRSNLVADFRPKRETAQLLFKSEQTILVTGVAAPRLLLLGQAGRTTVSDFATMQISAFRNRAALAC
jgi:hypothetical protein